MSHSPEDQAVEKRRKVLRGALAASGVVTMGYSGSALASFNCLQKTIKPAPINGGQLVQTVPSEYLEWEWEQVVVSADGNGVGDHIGWFSYLNVAYSVPLEKRPPSNWSATGNPVYAQNSPPDKPTLINMFLLVLYGPSSTGYVPDTPSPYIAGAAAAPGTNSAAVMPQPITESCQTSLNPGATGSGAMGG